MRRHSPYNYAFNNPIRYIDPDGMAVEDIIKFFKNGDIERIKTDDNFDTLSNEDGSVTQQIAKNEDGTSKIGEVQKREIAMTSPTGEKSDSYLFMQINDNNTATQVFEFAAENTNKEFAQDIYSLSDGSTASIVGTNKLSDQVSSSSFMSHYDLGNNNFISKSIHLENVHSHPGSGEISPSGYRGVFSKDRKYVSYSINPIQGGDRVTSSSAQVQYMYSPSLRKETGGGYIRFNNI